MKQMPRRRYKRQPPAEVTPVSYWRLNERYRAYARDVPEFAFPSFLETLMFDCERVRRP